MLFRSRQVDHRLAALESRLTDRPDEADEVRAIRLLLTDDRQRWIGTVEAQRLLGVKSVNTVKAWARLGLLRSKQEPNGRLKVHLDDILRQRQTREDLGAMGSVELPLSSEARQSLQQSATPEVQAIVNAVLIELHRAQDDVRGSGE